MSNDTTCAFCEKTPTVCLTCYNAMLDEYDNLQTRDNETLEVLEALTVAAVGMTDWLKRLESDPGGAFGSKVEMERKLRDALGQAEALLVRRYGGDLLEDDNDDVPPLERDAFLGDLSPELAAFASLLDAQPEPVRDAFNYCVCLLMVEAGKMRLVETVPGESGEVCVFALCWDDKTVAADRFSVVRPPIDEEQKTALIARLREILKEEEWL